MKKNILIRIVDDDEAFADAISFMLMSKGWQTVVYSSVTEFLANDDRSVPGCILLDYLMPDINGMQAQQKLMEEKCECPIVFLTAHADLDMAISVFRTGACDLLRKPVQPEALFAAIEKAVARDCRSSVHATVPLTAKERFEGLTPREKQIIKLAAIGLSNSSIAERFGISERTVEAHRCGAYKRLGVKNLEELQTALSYLQEQTD